MSTARYEITIGETTRVVQIRLLDAKGGLPARYWIQLDDAAPLEVEATRPVPDVLSLLVGTRSWEAGLVQTDEGFEVELLGTPHEAVVVDPRRKALRHSAGAGAGVLKTAMPGRVVRMLVAEGDEVAKGQPMVVVEAMKMENELKSPSAGTVARICVAEGDLVDAKTVLVELG